MKFLQSQPPGAMLGPYEIVSQLGQGGMGVVYQAHDPRLDRHVAIKLLPPDLTSDETAKHRFLQEAKAASALDHPNICTIHEINDTDDGQLYLVMAHYEGETLKQRIGRGPLKLDEAIDIATQVGEGLAKAHAAGIVHRDIKPANLMVTTDGTVKILDFGLAKLAGTEGVTQTGTTVGTVAYMSPEQAKGQEVDHRTDIWSLSVVLYEMLAGKPPFQGENLLSIADAIRGSDPAALTGPSASLQPVIAKALTKDQNHRYQAMMDLVGDLRTGGTPTPVVSPGAETEVPSIAVLPFVNMSADPEQEYFCDGLAEELIDALARQENLRVAARTSAFQFKGQLQDVAEIGQRLRVKFVLEGSVRKAGNRLRINAQLINATDGYHMWSERYDRVMEDVFEIQDDISRAILDKLTPRLVPTADRAIVERYAANIDAYNVFLKGRHHLHKRTPEGFRRAEEYFTQAIEMEPTMAPAYAGLADRYTVPAWYGAFAAAEANGKARSLARKALEISPDLGQARYTLGCVSGTFDWDWLEADRQFATAIRLNPNFAVGHCWHAVFSLFQADRTDDAIAELDKAAALEPLNPLVQTFNGIGRMLLRRYEEAVALFHAALELEPHFPLARGYLGETFCQLRRYDEAEGELLKAQPTEPGCHFSVGLLGYCYGRCGKPDQAHRLLSRLDDLSKTTYIPALSSAMTYIGLNRHDLALEWLKRAYEERYGALVWLGLEPIYDPLRSDPRFQALLRKMNFLGQVQ